MLPLIEGNMSKKKLFSEEPLELKSIENLEEYKKTQKIFFQCEKCGEKVIKQKASLKPELLCTKCLISKNNSQRTPEQKELIIKKIKQTKLRKYGDENYNNTSKNKQTCLERYGITNGGWTKEAIEKIKKTCNEKYNSDSPFGSKEIQKKIEKSFFERYGVKKPQQLKEIRLATVQTCLEKYGVNHPSKSDSVNKNRHTCYKYNNEHFDSLWELKLYIYAIENNLNIKRDPCSFKYVFEGKEYTYFPDFLVDGRLVEVKGDQFFENGKMINPYDRNQDGKYEAKHQCGLLNGVEFWKKENMKPILEYISEKYNDSYFEQFKEH